MVSLSRRFSSATLRLGTIVAVLAIAVGACSDDKIVYRDRAPFNQPADVASGFLGYYDTTTQQTTCGNCHAGYQGSWKQTRHANAYATLASNDHSQAFCYSCHTVNGRGNAVSGTTAGHDAVAHATYRDVQCESCHGPGLEHVQGVGQGTIVRPLARVATGAAGTCADCHSGTHHPFAEEWEQSGHAEINAGASTNVSSGCASCHDGRKALEAWGVNANYVERDGTQPLATTCAVCHDPHGSAHSAQLRFSISSQDPTQNLCMQCHFRRFEPSVTQSSPHAPQGAVLMGLAGWRPPGFVYDTARIFGSHATTRNQKLCAGCHLGRYTATDEATGASFEATGHLMRAVPCLDASGKPTGNKDCGYTPAERSFRTCATSNCHGTGATDGIDLAGQQVAATLLNGVRTRMKQYTDDLWIDANGNGSMQAAPTDGGLLPTVRQTQPGEWSTSDNRISPAEGAEFNARLCGEYGQSNSDNSKGVHNAFLCEALLVATIEYVRDYYGLPGAPAGAPTHGQLSGHRAAAVQISRTPLTR